MNAKLFLESEDILNSGVNKMAQDLEVGENVVTITICWFDLKINIRNV